MLCVLVFVGHIVCCERVCAVVSAALGEFLSVYAARIMTTNGKAKYRKTTTTMTMAFN